MAYLANVSTPKLRLWPIDVFCPRTPVCVQSIERRNFHVVLMHRAAYQRRWILQMRWRWVFGQRGSSSEMVEVALDFRCRQCEDLTLYAFNLAASGASRRCEGWHNCSDCQPILRMPWQLVNAIEKQWIMDACVVSWIVTNPIKRRGDDIHRCCAIVVPSFHRCAAFSKDDPWEKSWTTKMRCFAVALLNATFLQ